MAAITVTILATVAPLGSATLGPVQSADSFLWLSQASSAWGLVGMTSHGTQRPWHKAIVEVTASSVSAISVVLASPPRQGLLVYCEVCSIVTLNSLILTPALGKTLPATDAAGPCGWAVSRTVL